MTSSNGSAPICTTLRILAVMFTIGIWVDLAVSAQAATKLERVLESFIAMFALNPLPVYK